MDLRIAIEMVNEGFGRLNPINKRLQRALEIRNHSSVGPMKGEGPRAHLSIFVDMSSTFVSKLSHTVPES
jgi:hypothetical protein